MEQRPRAPRVTCEKCRAPTKIRDTADYSPQQGHPRTYRTRVCLNPKCRHEQRTVEVPTKQFMAGCDPKALTVRVLSKTLHARTRKHIVTSRIEPGSSLTPALTFCLMLKAARLSKLTGPLPHSQSSRRRRKPHLSYLLLQSQRDDAIREGLLTVISPKVYRLKNNRHSVRGFSANHGETLA